MIFGKINHIILLGGSRCTAELALYLSQIHSLKCEVYTAPRQVMDIIYSDGLTFDGYFKQHSLKYFVSEDINLEQGFIQSITDQTLALGLGEAWSFNKEIINKFNGRLLDLMGIRMPQYRGGAHYTWQILRGNRIGACNLQVINEEMVQGVFDSGRIIKFREYLFPASARIPDDYFAHAVSEEISFIKEFIDELSQNTNFNTFTLQENFSIYLPRLNTIKNAFINWQWNTQDIEKFICAFDSPYAGATTQINGNLVRVKKARSEQNDGPFHPFQSGLIYKIYNEALYVASNQGTIVISEVNDENGSPILHLLKTGDRFFTPEKWIEKGMTTKINM
jgi:methionyl-tRNA formyltransferase